VFADVAELLTFSAEKVLTKAEKEKLDVFLTRFVAVFFRPDGTPVPGADNAHAADGATAMDISQPAAAAPAPAPAPAAAETDGKVKPVLTRVPEGQPGAAAAAAASAPAAAPAAASDRRVRLFFGGTSFYVFFRLYQTLYERVALAAQLARSPREKFIIVEPPKSDKTAEGPAAARERAAAERERLEAEAKKDRYKEFIKMLYSFVAGTLEQNKYEDEMRDLLGIQAFPLYTLDKLVVQLVKQIQSILSDEISGKLLALYAYEEARQSGFLENIYTANALEILGEERCFKIEYELAPQAGNVGITLLDSVNQPRFMELSFNKEKWSQYVDNYAQGDTAADLDVRKHHIFLIRNKKKNANS
jgi:paired amphipathic helix protein Sin3a